MIAIISTLLGGIVDGISTHYAGKKEIKKAKLEALKIEIQANADIKKALAQSKLVQAQTGQVQDYNLDIINTKNMQNSWKDELLLILYCTPVILAFIPSMQEVALKGFKIIEQMPLWYTVTFTAMSFVLFGMRGLFKEILKTKRSK